MSETHKWIWRLALIAMGLIIVPMLIDLVNMVVTAPRIDYQLRFAANRGIQYVNQETFRGGGIGGTNLGGNFVNARSIENHTGLNINAETDPAWADVFGTSEAATILGEVFLTRTAPTAFMMDGVSNLGSANYNEVNAARRWAWMYGDNAAPRHLTQMENLRQDLNNNPGFQNSGLGQDLTAWMRGPGQDEYFGYQMLTPNNMGVAFVPIEAAQRAARWQLVNLLTAGNIDRMYARNGLVYVIWQGWEVEITSLVLHERASEMFNIADPVRRADFARLIGAAEAAAFAQNESFASNGSGWTRVIYFDFEVNMRYVGISGFRIFAGALQDSFPDADFLFATDAGDFDPTVQRFLTASSERAGNIEYSHRANVGGNAGITAGFDQGNWDADAHWGNGARDSGRAGGLGRSWFSTSRVGSGRLMYYHVH